MSEFGTGFKCDFCDQTWPHHHGETTNSDGERIEVVLHHVEDPNAEVRDPDTGDVIFRATKAPFKLIGGGKKDLTP